MPDVPHFFRELKRTVFDHCQKSMRAEERVAALAQEELSGSRFLPCSVQHKKNGRKTLRPLPRAGDLSRYYLSTNLCPAHRMENLKPCTRIWMPEEACAVHKHPAYRMRGGHRFRSVIRLAAGLDSILQAAGRCNRHGGRPGRGRMWCAWTAMRKIWIVCETSRTGGIFFWMLYA